MVRPAGLRPAWRHAVLLGVHLDSPNFTPRALPGPIPGGSASLAFCACRP